MWLIEKRQLSHYWLMGRRSGKEQCRGVGLRARGQQRQLLVQNLDLQLVGLRLSLCVDVRLLGAALPEIQLFLRAHVLCLQSPFLLPLLFQLAL